jgi:hypothetical protein
MKISGLSVEINETAGQKAKERRAAFPKYGWYLYAKVV